MKIEVVGGGPGGLYFGILAKKAFPETEIVVHERNPEGVTWGWGVVFSGETMGNFADADRESFDRISETFARWDAIDVHIGGECVTSGGHDFAGIYRMKMLEILTERARELGVVVKFGDEITDIEELRKNADLVVAADGINSMVRERYNDSFKGVMRPGKARFIWLGSDKEWDTFTFLIRNNEHGLFQVHAYQFDDTRSTFIVECDEQSWLNAGLDKASEAESIAYCEKLFADDLKGAKLIGNNSAWITFRQLKCESWRHENVVIIGDAAHTAHFSIGSGTKLAMEDVIVLVDAMKQHPDDVGKALDAYWDARWLDVAKLQRAAKVSREWFEDINRYAEMSPQQFTASLLSRSKRVTHENLRMRDPAYVEKFDRWFAADQGHEGEPVPPPMFLPFELRGMKLINRVVVSPMCQYSAEDGMPNDWHLVHLGSRAIGGAGLVIAEMTDVSALGRISPGCTGMYDAAHAGGWRRITDFVHEHSEAKIALQLGHAGRKGSTQFLWDTADAPLPEGNWPLLSASAIAWTPDNQTPKAMDRADMDAVRDDFVKAAKMAVDAGFDMLELHCAHGYLLASFVSPLTNVRTDEYGGSLENRLRYPLEVFDAVRTVWPDERPMSVRISANDWADGGVTPEDAVEIARAFQAHGCDIIDVSSGQTVKDETPVYGRMFQTPFSDRIRNEVGMPTMAVGNVQGWDHVNTIVGSGRADLCALARPHLYDPYLTLHAAAEQGWHEHVTWPKQYRSQWAVSARIAEEREAEFNERRQRNEAEAKRR